MDDRRRDLACFLVAAALLGVFKLWLVHADEVVAIPGNLDQLLYARMADHLWEGRWLGPYDQTTLVRSPGFPAWMALVRSVGLPLRLASEVALWAAAAVFGLVSLRAGARVSAAILAVAFFVLCPRSYAINNEVLSEVFYTPVLVMAVAAAGAGWMSTTRRGKVLAAAGLAVALALLWHTRPERGLVVALLATVVAMHAASGPRTLGARLSRLTIPVAGPALAIVVSTVALSLANQKAYGVYIDNELLGGGFQALHEALLRIDTPRRAYLAVPEASRRLAYEVSPGLRRLEPFLEGNRKADLLPPSCAQFRICDDIANGWFLFALRDSAFLAGLHGDARTADAFYESAAHDVNAACASGRFKCRSTLSLPYVARERFADLPRSLRQVVGWMTSPAGSGTPMSDAPEADPAARAVFDRAALRRLALRAAGTYEVSGWAFAEGPVAAIRVSLQDASGVLLGTTETIVARPDVVQYFGQRGIEAPERTGFRVAGTLPAGDARLPRAEILFTLADGRTERAPVLSDTVPRPVRYSVEVLREDPRARSRVYAIRGALEKGYDRALVGAFWLALLVSARRFWRSRSLGLPRPLAGLVALTLAVVGARLLYFTAVNTFLFGGGPRYLYPVMGLAGAALVLAIAGERREATRSESPQTSPLA